MSNESGTLDSVLEDRRAAREVEPEAVETEAVEAEEEYQEPEDTGEAEEAPEDAPEAEEEAPVVDAPHYWPADKKAEFAKLPPELQALVAEQEAGRVRAVNQAQQQAVEVRKGIEAEIAQTQAVNARLAQAAETAEAYHSRVIPDLGMTWEQVDWQAWFAQDRATAAAYRAQYDAEREDLQRVQSAKEEAEATAYRQFLQAEALKLPEVAPDLADPVNGPKRKAELGQYLTSRGYTQDRIGRFGALDLSLAYKAMMYDAAQANAQALKSAPQKPAAPARPVRPAASAPAPTQTARIRELEARVARSGSLDDVLALRRAKRKAG